MNRLPGTRIKEADAVLKTLRSSIVPISIGEIHHRISQVSGVDDFDIIGTLIFHYGLAKKDDGYYHLTEEGKKAADIGFRAYSRKRDRKERKRKVIERTYQQRTSQDTPRIVFVEKQGRLFWGIDWEELLTVGRFFCYTANFTSNNKQSQDCFFLCPFCLILLYITLQKNKQGYDYDIV